MNTLSAPSNAQNLLTPIPATPLHGVSFVRRLACRRVLSNRNRNSNSAKCVMMVTPHRTFKKDEAAMTPRKVLPTMEEYRARNVDLVHVGKYLVSLQPENCRSLDFFFENEKESGDIENNAENTFPATSYQTPPRTSDVNNKHLLLSPPTLLPPPPAAKRQRVLFTTTMPKSIPRFEQDSGSELSPTKLRPRNLNLRFGALANDTTLAFE